MNVTIPLAIFDSSKNNRFEKQIEKGGSNYQSSSGEVRQSIEDGIYSYTSIAANGKCLFKKSMRTAVLSSI